jgi:transcriptional regulator with XRE-family HTH domain
MLTACRGREENGYVAELSVTTRPYTLELRPMPRPNGRDPRSNPAAFLGSRLRRARVNAGFTSQEALASALGFDRTVVTKGETGDRVPTDDVLTVWCEACKIDPEMFEGLADLARSTGAPVPTWFEDWLAAEEAAAVLKYWSPIIMTPIFQTAGYARALLLAAQTDTSDEAIGALVTAKLERATILDRPDPPDVIALVDELVLHRLIGSPEIMHDQLVHIAELAERPYVCVQVVPTAVGATAGLSGDISLASGDGAPEALHTDAVPEGHTTESRSMVRRAAVAFERIRGYALPRAQSRDLIMEVANERWKQ